MNSLIISFLLISNQCQLEINKAEYRKCIKEPDNCKNSKNVGDCIMKKFIKCAHIYRKCEQ